MKVPYLNFSSMHDSDFTVKAMDAFRDFIDSHYYVLGNGVSAFEQELSEYLDCNHVIGVASGLDALIISLKSLGIGPGDKVMVPSNTYIATWLAVTHVGAEVLPVEPDPQSYNLSCQGINNAISEEVRAVIPVHLYGRACPMEEIRVLAQQHNILVVEDNAQAIGAMENSSFTGTFGDVNAFSFYPGKNLGALGDAGAIATNDPEVADLCRSLRNYGSKKKYYNNIKGYNSRLDEFQAKILSIKLQLLDGWNEERIRIANRYSNNLKLVKEITLPSDTPHKNNVYHIYPIMTELRDALQTHLNQNEIQTLIHYPLPPHLQKAYHELNYQRGDFPIAEKIANQELSLPIYPGMSDSMIDYVSETIIEFFLK